MDYWYPRSMGSASLTEYEDGSLGIQGRTMDWNSPGHDFDLIAGNQYSFKVEVFQDEQTEAQMILSVAHTKDGTESYENLAFAKAKKGEWTTLEAGYVAGDFDRFVIYIETLGAPTLAYQFRNFTFTGVEAVFGSAETGSETTEVPSLKEKFQDYFAFGTAVTQNEAYNRQRMDFYASQFNIMTPGNELKPDYVLDVSASAKLAAEDECQAAVHFDRVKPLLTYAWEHGIKIHGHVLVWHQQTPEAFFHEGYNISKPLVTREVLLGRLSSYTEKIMEYLEENYPGMVVSWDVLNEAIDDQTGQLRDSKWLSIVGEDYPERAYEIARKYAPEGVQLYYNDYNTAYEPKQTGIVHLLERLLADGTVDGYGFQMHHDLSQPSVDQIRKSLERIAALPLKLRVSELDLTIPDNQEATLEKQAAKYKAIFELLLPYRDRLEAVQVWGVTDDLSWRAWGYPLLFDHNAQPKPAFYAILETLPE
ncbi:MAG: endo-1,4-beta-xylanase [Clostridia bacterium]|nr:endo-1,4-beta-xylanase [Clostridia bacterium]